jgi:hypothetical protein
MLKRLAIGCVLVAALAIPSVASAEQSPGGDFKNAARQCKALRAKLGPERFRAEFGGDEQTRNAFGNCVAKLRDRGRAAKKAFEECKAEYLADPAAFLLKYGSEQPADAASERPVNGGEGKPPHPGDAPGEGRPDKPNHPDAAVRAAVKRCVGLKLKERKAERRDAFEKAVKECKAEYVADPEAFVQKYGETDNKREAFGRCVSSKVREGVV